MPNLIRVDNSNDTMVPADDNETLADAIADLQCMHFEIGADETALAEMDAEGDMSDYQYEAATDIIADSQDTLDKFKARIEVAFGISINFEMTVKTAAEAIMFPLVNELAKYDG